MEGYMNTGLVYRAQEPYPEVRAERRDRRYAEAMMDNVGGGNSELTAAGLYLYDSWVTEEPPEVSEALREISAVELHHLEIFATLTRQLGEDPRLWGCYQGRKHWWMPGNLPYQRRLGPLLRMAVREEKASIRKYRAQARWIGDKNVVENLKRVVMDEEKHLVTLGMLYDTYVGPGQG